jgi:hypothetical protein
MKKVMIVAAAAMLFAAGTAQAEVVAEWDTSGKTGTEVSIAGAGSAQVTAADLVRGAGVAASSAANNFGSTGWNGVNANDYIQFGMTVANGYQANLNELWISTRSSSTGPGTIGLYSSLDNYTSAITTITQPSAAYVNSKIDLSSLGIITNTVYFRVMEINDTAPNGSATAGTGTFRVGDYYDGSAFLNIILEGETSSSTPTPVPAAAWLLGSGLLGLVGLRRRQA